MEWRCHDSRRDHDLAIEKAGQRLKELEQEERRDPTSDRFTARNLTTPADTSHSVPGR